MPTLGQLVFYYSQPDSELVANPAQYLGESITESGKHVLLVAWTQLGGPGGVARIDNATLVTASPTAGDFSEANLL